MVFLIDEMEQYGTSVGPESKKCLGRVEKSLLDYDNPRAVLLCALQFLKKYNHMRSVPFIFIARGLEDAMEFVELDSSLKNWVKVSRELETNSHFSTEWSDVRQNETIFVGPLISTCGAFPTEMYTQDTPSQAINRGERRYHGTPDYFLKT